MRTMRQQAEQVLVERSMELLKASHEMFRARQRMRIALANYFGIPTDHCAAEAFTDSLPGTREELIKVFNLGTLANETAQEESEGHES